MTRPAEPRYPLHAPLRLLVLEDCPARYQQLVADLSQAGLNVACTPAADHQAPPDEAPHDEDPPDEAPHDAEGGEVFDAILLCASHEGLADEVAALRRDHRHAALVVTCEAPDPAEVAAAMRCGADDVVSRTRPAALRTAITGAIRSATARREEIARASALRESEARLRELAAHLQSVLESERAAIAREIHDDIGGTLTALRYDLAWIARNGDAASAERALESLESVALAEQAGQRLVRDLRPPVLDAGILAALEWQLAQFRKRTGAKARLRANTDRFDLSDEVAITVYRTLQEALTNVVKHASATRVDVDLVVRDDVLSLEILDDGRGVAASDAAKAGSFGLRGLRERATAVGGWLELSAARAGTALLLTVPTLAANGPTSAEPSSIGLRSTEPEPNEAARR